MERDADQPAVRSRAAQLPGCGWGACLGGLLPRRRPPARADAVAPGRAAASALPDAAAASLLTALDRIQASRPVPGAAAPANQQLVERLCAIRARFQALLDMNYGSDEAERTLDAAVLPVLVAAANHRRAGLHLRLVPPGQRLPDLRPWLAALPGQAGRVLLSLPPSHQHTIAADARLIEGRLSLVALDSLGLRGAALQRWQGLHLPALRAQLGGDATLVVLALDSQLSASGCHLYALAHAQEMAAQPAWLDRLHRQSPGPTPWLRADGKAVVDVAAAGNVRLVEAMGLLPARFYKHAQSRKLLQAVAEADAPVPVNRKGQTLLQRDDQHRTMRWEQRPAALRAVVGTASTAPAPAMRSVLTSNSLEIRRLAWIERAIAYCASAPEDVARRLLQAAPDLAAPLGDAAEWARAQRSWGPAPGPR